MSLPSLTWVAGSTSRGSCPDAPFSRCTTLGSKNSAIPNLPTLTKKHLVLVAAVADPEVDEMATRRGDAAAVYEAAAERTRARRRITEELRRHGVEVVDATPEHFAPALADTYIALKAAGRL